MLAPQVEAEPSEEGLLGLLLESRAMWAEFARELESASGMTVDYRTEGTIVVAIDRDDVERLRFQYDYHRGLGLDVAWLSGYEARQREPHLSPAANAAVFSPLDHQVDNRKTATALKAEFRAAAGQLQEGEEVTRILVEGDAVIGVEVGGEPVSAGTVILAAGAWSRGIDGLPATAQPPVRPVKGQMLSVAMNPAAPLIEHVVWGPDIYLVPRLDGRLIIGATVEEMGFDDRLTAGGLYELTRHAWATLPGIYDLPVIETWTGFRPTSRDDAPILGPTEVDGLIMATGHHRNGILLAPLTAHAISHLVLTGEMMESIKPFTLRRFATVG
jgi:glycine oxidase